jgi:hypothetical protein
MWGGEKIKTIQSFKHQIIQLYIETLKTAYTIV